MPKPRMGESEDAFVKRCIPIVIEDGTAKDGSQGNAICHSMFTQHKKELDEEVKQRSEDVQQMYDTLMTNSGITSFSQLQDISQSSDVIDDVDAMASMLGWMIFNIKHDDTVADKETAVSKAVDEFASMAKDVLAGKTEAKTLFDQLKEALGFKETFKTEAGKKFHASDYAFVPDATKPSTWKLRLAETPGKVTVAQLGRAAAAFSSGGFRGNKVQGLGSGAGAAKAKIRAAYKRLGVKDADIPDSVKEKSGLTIFKDKNGSYRFVALYSNNFRDDDNPSEIISAQSHKRFVEMVDAKEVPMPELEHWHIPGSRWGVAEMVAFDEESGIAMAAGVIDPGHEKEAQYFMDHPELDIRMSHGMPVKSIARDPEDTTVITEHLTKEISDLPGWAAANKFTSFIVLGSEDSEMALPDQKKQYLKDMGYSDEQIASIEGGVAAVGKEARESGVESKEANTTPPATETTETPTTDAQSTETETPKEEADKGKEVVSEFLTKEEFTSTVAEALLINNTELLKQVQALVEKALAPISERVDTLTKEQSDLNVTPTASLGAIIAQRMTAIGNKDAQLRKDSNLSKQAPEETPADAPKTVNTGNAVIDTFVPNLWKKPGGN